MFFNEKDKKLQFKKNLFKFLHSRNIGHLKVPQIGGRELDLYELYQKVIHRGGSVNVTAKKMWKDIVNEFELPSSCTSASHTLKNHYEKYLLAYEQMFYFNKNEDDMIKDLGSVRQKRIKPANSSQYQLDMTRKLIEVNREVAPNLKSKLLNRYAKVSKRHKTPEERNKEKIHKLKNDTIHCVARQKISTFSGVMRRVLLAFESQLQEEIRFALNHLLMYSCSDTSIIELKKHKTMFIGMMKYLEFISQNIPYMFKSGSKVPKINLRAHIEEENGTGTEGMALESEELNVFENYNFEIFELVKNKAQPPLKNLREQNKDPNRCQLTPYEDISTAEISEQIRIIFQILRNFVLIPQNQEFVYQQKGILNFILDYFSSTLDDEVRRNSLEVVSVLCKHIILQNLTPERAQNLLNQIVHNLESDYNEEHEAALESLHSLMLSQENEMNIENALPSFIQSLTKLLLSSSLEAISSSLEILCYLSDLKMSTRLILAKETYLIQRLIALIAGNFNKITEKNAKLSAMIISNICITSAAKKFFIPYEKDLFCLAACDDTVSEILAGVLQELDGAKADPLENSKTFYSNIQQQIAQISNKITA